MFTKPNNEEGYTSVDFTEEETIVSSQFDQLVLSVKELLNPPIVEELIKEEQTTIKTLAEQAENERQRAETLEQQVETLENSTVFDHTLKNSHQQLLTKRHCCNIMPI